MSEKGDRVPQVDFGLPHRTLVGCDVLLQAGEEAIRFGKRAFVGCGHSAMRQHGTLDTLLGSLKKAGIETFVFDDIEGNPSTATVERGLRAARKFKAESFIGIGGGSALDATKFIALLLNNPGAAADYLMGDRAPESPGNPVIAIPSTAGTGSEANHIAVITNEHNSIKKGARHPDMVPRVTMLDPKVSATMPPDLTADTGLDALAHAVESYVSTGATPLSEALSLRAIRLIFSNLAAAVNEPDNLDARYAMALAAYMAGASLMAGVGLCHELAMAIGSYRGGHHGELVARLMVPCLAVNRNYCAEKICRVADVQGGDVNEALSHIADFVGQSIGVESFSALYDLSADSIDEILRISKISTNIKTNPRHVDDELRTEVLTQLIQKGKVEI